MSFYLIPASFTICSAALARGAGGDYDTYDDEGQSYDDDFFHIFDG
ncbi:MAG: hypothetical protein JXA23_02720 [Bacteroidales bacterium]|nr:hypothetical protein [Bacteroidales bacterium]